MAFVCILLAERWRGEYSLAKWLEDKAARGEFFDLDRLWPPASPADESFSNRLAEAIGRLPKRWYEYGGRLSGMVMSGPGHVRRGSQEPQPPMQGGARATDTWPDLGALIGEAEPALAELRKLMKNPAASLGPKVHQELLKLDEPVPNFVKIRTTAQALQTAALARLHEGDLEGALENLEALSATSRLYADEPFLVCYMVRIAILGLSDDAHWDALQAAGWSEPQLARLQQAAQGDELLSQMPRAMQAEMAGRLRGSRQFAAHSYEDWVGRHEELFQSFGCKPPACDTGPAVRRWRQWVFHPVWGFAWADQERLHTLQTGYKDLEVLREAIRRQGWCGSDERLAQLHRDYRPPPLSWRFYIGLPMLDRLFESAGISAPTAQAYPFGNFSRAWSTAMKNLTIHEMVKTSIALNRYKLRHGQCPERLEGLTPVFLAVLPRDLMNGEVLRYNRHPDGTFTLYSVGLNGTDEGGDPMPPSLDKNAGVSSPWDGRDWVWPGGVSRGS